MKNTLKKLANGLMKKSFILLPAFLILVSAFTPPVKKASPRKRQGNITFQQDIINMGELESGKAYSRTVTFTNTGKDPVTIYSCQSSCGAYVSEFPKKPIKPNATGTIKVIYQPRETPGFFSKSIIIESNSRNGQDYVYLQGKVNVISVSRK